MDSSLPIRRTEILGKRISAIFHVALAYDHEKQYQPKLIILELDSGLRVSLQQKSEIVNQVTGEGQIYPYEGQIEVEPTVLSVNESNLSSAIQKIVRPYDWLYSFGVMLENGVSIHDSFSCWENGAIIYRPSPQTLADFVDVTLPE